MLKAEDRWLNDSQYKYTVLFWL